MLRAIFFVLALYTGTIMAAPIPDDIKKVVTFILIDDGKGGLTPNGTGFFVGVKHPTDPKKSFVYLATARHVISSAPFGPLYPHIYVRVSKRSGGTELAKIPLITSGADRTVYVHTDPSVDLAVIPTILSDAVLDVRYIPDDLITTKSRFAELGISEGSEVFFAGLFTQFLGEQSNYPVVRFGRVALITPEKIPWGDRKMDLYLLESSSFGGNSGSPVFFYLGSDRVPGSLIVGPPQIFLAGVMMGAYQDVRPVGVVETARIPVSTSNLGISAVVPAFRLHELLLSKELEDLRKR